jgi:hypothetical protein
VASDRDTERSDLSLDLKGEVMTSNDSLQRSVLPIPDRKPIGLTTYDAKDPDTKFPPITQLRPPTGAPERAHRSA